MTSQPIPSVPSPFIPDVTVYARHSPDCKFQTPGLLSKCTCKKYVYVARTPSSKEQRIATYSRSWEVAEQRAQQIRNSFDPVKRELETLKEEQRRETEHQQRLISSALSDWIADKEKGKPGGDIGAIYYTIENQLSAYAAENGLHFLHELTTEVLTRWRNSWGCQKSSGIRHKTSRVIAFFNFCVRMGWLKKNPAGGRQNPEGGLTKITVDDWAPCPPFTPEQFDEIMDATYLYPVYNRRDSLDTPERLRALTLLLRWSGMAPIDALKLRRDELGEDNIIRLARRKTGVPFVVAVPDFVGAALRRVPPGRTEHPEYFFWNGTAGNISLRSIWWRHYDKLFQLIKTPLVIRNRKKQIVRPHPYMFRHTFAVEFLKAGGDIFFLAKLLGNTVKMCEKHYLDYVPALQKRVIEHQMATFTAQGVAPFESAKVIGFRRPGLTAKGASSRA